MDEIDFMLIFAPYPLAVILGVTWALFGETAHAGSCVELASDLWESTYWSLAILAATIVGAFYFVRFETGYTSVGSIWLDIPIWIFAPIGLLLGLSLPCLILFYLWPISVFLTGAWPAYWIIC